MAGDIISDADRRLVQEIEYITRRLTAACQDCQSNHMLSSALAYLRYTIAQAQKRDPGDLTWNDMALAFSKAHHDLVILGNIHVNRGSSMAQAYNIRGDAALCGMLELMVRT